MRAIFRLLVLAVVLWVAYAFVGPYVDDAIYAIRLSSMPAPRAVTLPVRGVTRKKLNDTWQAARSGGRKHEGIDIFAPRGTPVYSATEGIIMRVGENRLGGQVVWVLGPGGQRHYYAHLDRFADVERGQRVRAGTIIGYAGTTGNARGTPPHLHYGIYEAGGAINPYPLLRVENTSQPSNA